jgi:hypothetical protein
MEKQKKKKLIFSTNYLPVVCFLLFCLFVCLFVWFYAYWLSWSHHFESFTIGNMTWLTVVKYLCHKWPRICSICRKHFPSFPHAWLITGFVAKLTRRVLVVEQGLLTLPVFSPGFEWGSCCSIFSFMCMFCRCSILVSNNPLLRKPHRWYNDPPLWYVFVFHFTPCKTMIWLIKFLVF